MRKMAGLLLAAALTVGLSAGVGTDAHASTTAAMVPRLATPSPGTYYEITPLLISPISPKCLDVPGASTTPDVALQLFHCKSSSNQLWRFDQVTGPVYQIVNQHSGLCLKLQEPSAPITQGACDSPIWTYWVFTTTFDPTRFLLRHDYFDTLCLAAANNSGADHTQVVPATCDPGPAIWAQNPLQTLALG
jgi:Ricin-type beta-trefoil lectin domain-like